MSAPGIFHQDQVTTPIGIINLKFNFPASARCRNNSVGNGRDRRVVHVRAQIFFGAVPPPRPVKLVDFIFYIVARNLFPIRIQGNNIKNDGFVCLQKARCFCLRCFHSGVHAIRRVISGLRIKTHVAAGFENARHNIAPQHARCTFSNRNPRIHTRHTRCIKRSFKQLVAVGFKLEKRIVENIFIVSRKRIFRTRKSDFHFRFQVRCRRTVQPLRRERSRKNTFTCIDNGIGFQTYFQPVRLDSFYPQRFVERSAAHLHVRLPNTGGCRWVGSNPESVKSIFSVGFHLAVIKLTRGRVNFERNGMSFGQFLCLVFQDKRQVDGVAGTPNTSLAIYRTF